MSTRRVTRKRTYRKTAGSKTMHKVARQEAKKVINREIETKFFEGNTTLAGGSPQEVTTFGTNMLLTKDYSAGIVTSANGQSIIQGIGSADFIGLSIHPVFVSINITLVSPLGIGAENYDTVSVMVIQAKGAFTFNQISTANQLTNNNTANAPLGFIPRDYNDRYRVLYHKRFALDIDDPVRTFNIRINSKKLRRIAFDGASGIIEANPLVLSVVSDSAATPHPEIYASWRLYYKDA